METGLNSGPEGLLHCLEIRPNSYFFFQGDTTILSGTVFSIMLPRESYLLQDAAYFMDGTTRH